MPAEGSLQNTNSEGGEVNNSGVKLPPGIKSEPSNHGSIKFGSIEPSDYQQTTTHPRQTGGAANQASNQGPSHGSHPKTAGQNPVTNSNKQNSSNAPTSRSGQGGNRVPRAPQQPVAVAGMPQPSPYATQSMATAYVLSPPGAPVSAYPQAYMLAYNPSAAAGSQSYYTGGSFGQGQYGAYNYGTTVPGPALGGNIPEVQNMQMASLPQTSTYMPNQSTASKPPQPTPVVQRQKRILRIENPDTHEVLDLAGIRADTDTKKTVPKDEAATDTAKEPEVWLHVQSMLLESKIFVFRHALSLRTLSHTGKTGSRRGFLGKGCREANEHCAHCRRYRGERS